MPPPDHAPLRVVIADDDQRYAELIAALLHDQPEFDVIGIAKDGEEAVQLATWQDADVVLMDIRMPVQDGLVTTERLLADPNPPRVLVLTTFDADDLVLRALRLGASGFLLKDTPPPKMIEAIRAVARGEPALSPSVTYQVIAAATGARRPAVPEAREELSRLTERELEVAIEVARGASNAEIAERLHMSVATVKAHVSRLLTKLDASNRVQIALLVQDAGAQSG